MEDANQKSKIKNQNLGTRDTPTHPQRDRQRRKRRRQKIKKNSDKGFVLLVGIFFSYIAENTSKKKDWSKLKSNK